MLIEGIRLIMKEFLMNKSALEFSMLNLHSEKVGLILNAKKRQHRYANDPILPRTN